MPHRHVADIAETTDAERDELAPLYLRLLRGDRRAVRLPRRRTSPPGIRRPCTSDATRCGCGCELTSPRRAADKLKFLAGSEAAMGAWIGDVPPETAAARLRDAARDRSGGDARDRRRRSARALFAELTGAEPGRRLVGARAAST